jgi:putative SOS response-associated peptidase YedK
MCGRFTLRTPTKDIVKAFGLVDAPDLKPRFNIAPTQRIAAIKFDPETVLATNNSEDGPHAS